MIANSVFLLSLDKLDASFRSADAIARQGVLNGLLPTLPAPTTATAAYLSAMLGPAQQVYAAASPDQQNLGVYRNLFQGLNQFLSTYTSGLGVTGISTLDQFASYQNSPVTGARFSFLVGPNLALLYWLFASNALRTNTAALMQPGNVFAPQTLFASAIVGAGGAVTPGLTGNAIKTANDASAAPQGYTPAPGVQAAATVAVNGTLSLSVTYSGMSAVGVAFAGHVGTLVVDNLAQGATTAAGAWTPQTAGDRVSAVTAIASTGAATATAGQFTLQSIIERVTS